MRAPHYRDLPHWSSAFALRARVRSTYTGNTGTVVAIDPGRRLLVCWDAEPHRGSYEAWTSHPGDLEVVA